MKIAEMRTGMTVWAANFVKGIEKALVIMRLVGFEGGRTAEAEDMII